MQEATTLQPTCLIIPHVLELRGDTFLVLKSYSLLENHLLDPLVAQILDLNPASLCLAEHVVASRQPRCQAPHDSWRAESGTGWCQGDSCSFGPHRPACGPQLCSTVPCDIDTQLEYGVALGYP